ncbi:MAG: HAMP domain-containing histidine kinase [Verrucomicrobiae bacterium]|nr:HAMP domain-containing histidine kinase [Verrucomicrobiae bacterium]
MAAPTPPRKPTFLWQGLLIVLPVAVLAAVGFLSLRQDRRLAEREAAERAQAVADDLLESIWTELAVTNLSGRLHFTIDAVGELLFPPPHPSIPIPRPFDLAELDSNGTQLWLAAQSTSDNEYNLASAEQVWRDFIRTDPPERFAAAAHHRLGLLLLQQQKLAEAAEALGLVARTSPGAVGESGLPLQPLAQWKLLELAATTTNDLSLTNLVSAESFYSNVVFHPSPLTPLFLRTPPDQEAEPATMWRQRHLALWEMHECLRDFYAAAKPHLVGDQQTSRISSLPFTNTTRGRQFPRLFWFTLPEGWRRDLPASSADATPTHFNIHDRNWLAVRSDGSKPGYSFLCLSEQHVHSALSRLLSGAKLIPDFFGVGVELGGQKLTLPDSDLRLWHYRHRGGKTGHVEKEYQTDLTGGTFEIATRTLASAAKLEAGGQILAVRVYLTSPTALFERQRTRTFWFGLLIGFSTVAAFIGLLAARRAFLRQHQLAEMKSNFVSSVSHELRAPIASVRLLAESLERGKISEPAKQHEYFRFIGQECRRLAALIENVLDFSRIEQGRKQYQFEPTNLSALVEQTVKLMEPYAVERGVRLELNPIRQGNVCQGNEHADEEFSVPHSADDHSPDSAVPCELNMDGRAMQQALVNLIDNAVKHSPKGETVTVELGIRNPKSEIRNAAAPLNPQPSTLNLSVTDHGPGIPAAEHAKIFERFYRLGSELRRETQGVGIGLSIVKHIVEAHGGRVRVESQPGKGSRFVIELPLTPQPNDE